MSAKSDPRRSTDVAGEEYTYRRRLRRSELLPAVGVGVGVGLLAFYVAKLLIQRTPLEVDRERARLPRPARSLVSSPDVDGE